MATFIYFLNKKVGENNFCVGSLHLNKSEMDAKLSPCSLSIKVTIWIFIQKHVGDLDTNMFSTKKPGVQKITDPCIIKINKYNDIDL